jgi:ADP-ribose pyrophosphatase
MKINSVEKIEHPGLKVLKVFKANCTTTKGKDIGWEYVSRKEDQSPEAKAKADAVMVVAVDDDASEVILVKQFRPPVGDYVYEFPAGLINEGETAKEAGLRELLEETGYTAKAEEASPPAYTSPGLTDESVQIMWASVDPDQIPVQDQDDTEDIEVVRLPIGDIKDFIESDVKMGAKCLVMLLAILLAETAQKEI